MSFPDDVTLQELVELQCEKYASKTAVICDHDETFGVPSLTYAQLNDRVNQLAHLLRAEGVGPGHTVALVVERSFGMIIGILGIIKAGAAYLPIAPDSPPDRITYILQDAGVKVVLAQANTTSQVVFHGRVICLDDRESYRGSTANPPVVNTANDLAYIIYTSGSTGKPKGVMIEHRSLVNRLHWMQRAYPIAPGDVILQKTPYYFDVSVWELVWWALEGAAVSMLVPRGERNPLALIDAIGKHAVTVMHFVPSMLNVFLEYLEGKPAAVTGGLSSVRQVFASGEALTPSHVKRFNHVWGGKTGARLTNLYGPTEATIDVSYFDCPTHNDVDVVPLGRPIQNTRLYVIRDDCEVSIGEAGELCIAGVGLARGYLNQPQLTAEKFTDNPVNPGERIYRTGDVARRLPDGTIEFLGRADHQIKVRGLRIELGEIENTIREYPGISDCVVVDKTYSESVVMLIAYVVCKPNAGTNGLREHVKKHLPDYMVPHRFEEIDDIPTTPNGKANRKTLRELAGQA